MSSMRLAGNRWEIRAEADVSMMLQRVFPEVLTDGPGVITLSNTEEHARRLQWFMLMYPMTMAEQDRFLLDAQASLHKAREKRVADLLTGQVQPRAFPLAIPARDYQRVAAEMAYTLKSLLLGDQVGTGKTVSYICLLTMPNTRPAVWVTMTHLQEQARREIRRFCPGLRVVVITRGTPYDIGLGRPNQPDVVVLNYHKLSGWAEALGAHARSLICDEAQELRHDETARYRAARYIRERVQYAMLGSGTPVYNYGGEIHNVMEIARPGALGTWQEFVTAWAQERDDRGRAIVTDPRALGAHMRANGFMLRRTRKDIGRELPRLSRTVHTVLSDPDVYHKMVGNAAELARIILSQGGSSFQKLKATQDMDRIMRQATGLAKAPYVAEFVKLLLESGEDRVLVFAWHRAVYDVLEDALRAYGVVKYTGTESAPAKKTALDLFCRSERDKQGHPQQRARVMLMSLRSGVGVDGLQHVCQVGVFAELDWSPKVMEDQCEGRLCRDGQQEATNFYYLVSEEGADPVMLDVLQIKTGQADGITDPDQEAVDVNLDPEKIKRLAESVLSKVA